MALLSFNSLNPTSRAPSYLLVAFLHSNGLPCLCQLIYIIIIVTTGNLPHPHQNQKFVERNIPIDYKKYHLQGSQLTFGMKA